MPQTFKHFVDSFGHKETTPTAIGGLVKKYTKIIITRFEMFVNSNFPTLFDRGKGENHGKEIDR